MADGAMVPVERLPNRRRMTAIGTVSVLVVRVTTASNTYTDKRSNLAEYILDTDTNSEEGINVQSQFMNVLVGHYHLIRSMKLP